MAIIEHAGYYENPLYNVCHAHTSCEIMHIVSGRVKIVTGDTISVLSDGDSALIKSRQLHEVMVEKNIDYKRFITVINPWELKNQLARPDLFSMLTDTSKSGIIVIRNMPELKPGFEKMTEIFTGGANIFLELSAALDIVSYFYDIVNPRSEKAAKHSGRILSEKVRAYLEQNYAESIRIADIAAENFISEGYLSHTFKAQMGMSPREYLSHIRVIRACELIRHTSMKLSDIAANTGFCSQSDMSRKVKEHFGTSPSEIRFGDKS